MAEKFKALTDKHIEFINNQHIFFVGTAGRAGMVNCLHWSTSNI